ncbi:MULTISPECIES: hypothetical protein [unclassified Bacillus (in: firmicutes)]|uniref:hypothetical protein n=1 Tax=unclassified Bacillus (in: firmicutes) TaxID=185979 RepID=UPI000BF1B999|nr:MULTISPECIES: hypothetical protein [unclassified Bacillus (in: firmicutes)]PEJ50767.1 hypothetical protein CN692_22845 [Bacillus sp. AFS002410]PEL07353.1 hypothetical protein CN601_19910 [Bacillus sp. AFS017336]
MGKRGRKKQETARVQITLFISNKEDKEIHEYITQATSNSAAGRELLLNAWRMNHKQFFSEQNKIEDIEIYDQNNELRFDTIPEGLEIVYEEGLQEVAGSMDDFYY